LRQSILEESDLGRRGYPPVFREVLDLVEAGWSVADVGRALGLETRQRLEQQGCGPPAFDAGRYKERNTVERCFAKLKQFRAVATRYDKREFMYQGHRRPGLDPDLATGSCSMIHGTRPG